MKKSILMSIKPKYVAKILNGEKTIEVRKKFPKDYVGWVYIYCTKDRKQCLIRNNINKTHHLDTYYWDEFESNLNGKVVARFWCDKVEDFDFCECSKYENNVKLYNECVNKDNELCAKACISCVQMVEYLHPKHTGKAIHISKLEVFDKPRELKEFYKVGAWKVFEEQFDSSYLKREQQEIMEELEQTITKAPQSYMFIEGEND